MCTSTARPPQNMPSPSCTSPYGPCKTRRIPEARAGYCVWPRISTTKIMNERIIDETKQGTHTHFLAYCLMLALPWWCGTPTNWARRSLAIVWVLNQASVHHLSAIISQQSILSANHLGGTYECKLMKNETKYYN